MIGGVIMLFVAIWMYQGAIEGKKENAFLWVIIGTIAFFVAQWIFVHLNVYILESIQDSRDAGMLEDRPLTSIKTDSMDGISGFLLSIYMELFPPFGGVVAAGLVRTIAILKKPVTLSNVFGGIKEVFVKIKGSFKVAD
jgi:hypothetical protein